jgi:hypothetical protein
MARPAPCVGGRARVVAFGATGRARARRPQVSPGRAVPPARRGKREAGTRPWSTPPAPSTSSAAAISMAPTTSSTRTCGRAPTEVRGRTKSMGGGRWGNQGGTLGGTQGGTRGVLKGYPRAFETGRPTRAFQHAFRTIRPCRSPSVAAHANAAADAIISHGWRACLSARTVCMLMLLMRVCVRVCVCVCLLVCLCARACTACVNELCARAPRGCMRPPIARRRRAVLIAQPAPRVGGRARGCVRCHRPGSRAFCRRCHLDVPHGQRGMGCAFWAHVRGRRRRRHLRHRRQRLGRRRQPRQLPGRVGEHRRRCAAGLSLGGGRGCTAWVLRG